MNKRKHALLENEIEMIQIVLREEGFPTKEYRLNLVDKLEDLKKECYNVHKIKTKRGKNGK